MQTYEYKKACSHMNLRAHTRDEARSPEPSAFLDSSHGQCGERFTDAEAHSGLGRACNMKVFLVVSKSRLLEHILLFNSWPSRCPSCPSSPPSFNHTTFRTRRTFKWQKFFFPFQYKLRKENQVKLQKIDFQREHIFQVFGQLALRLFSCRARRPPKLHSLKIRDPVVKKSPLLTLVEGTGVDDI